MSRRRSNASESLARFVSDSPTSPVSPPRQPSRPLNRRRHSSYTRLADHGDDSRTVTASLKPDPDPSASSSPSRNSPTLTSSLSRYLSSSRRGSQSVWAQTSATGSGTTTPAALAKDRDLRKPPPSGPLQALTSSLAFLPAFPFPGQKPAETASYAKGEGQMRVVPWSSIKALYVCFKPSSASLAASNAGEDEDTATSDIVNAWLVGLQELSAGGSRPWDPRLLCPEPPSPPLSDSSLPSPPPLSPPSTASAPSLISSSPSSSEDTPPHASPRKRRRPDWPTVTMLVSVPPAVWVERRDGGWREFDPKGMGVEEIMRNVLLVPSTAASTASTRFPLPSFLGHQSQPRITHQ
ncbi:hypothetical protein Rt10032_c02g0654 [Rhodotorula toruloides]|uniref:Uncharacterized protein n=1 Tax=Rhodotorula toruloides TaxID=5286 RepID=A0A511K8H8_RHOTO|nr:hypothetical protein Rt10032_c02g0654 [Rhodotorula toruloides]